MEAFGQVITESMACGTPVVAFNRTGPAEIILHKENGYLATPFESDDLAYGIKWVLKDEERWKELSDNSVTHVKKNYSSEIIAGKYIDAYNRLLS